MKTWRVRNIALVIFAYLKVTEVTSDIFLTDTEEVELVEKYNEPNGRIKCLAGCGSFCQNHDKDFKSSCDGHAGETYIRCHCRKNIPVTKNTCKEYSTEPYTRACTKSNFVPVYKNSKCYCGCKENKCDKVCQHETGLGRCKAENKQRINENPCECYCTDEDCDRKYSSFFRLASCDSKGNCVKKCNGTQKGLPLWCRLTKFKCRCVCEQPFCQQFCKMERKKPYGLCLSESNCHCQYTPFNDTDCRKYCTERTGTDNDHGTSVPSDHGQCVCNYDLCDRNLCFEKCATSDTCSVNDPSTCRDDPGALSIPQGTQTACSGKICWSGLVELGEQQNTSRPFVFARNKSESGNSSRVVVCRVFAHGLGIAIVDKLNSDMAQCLIVALVADVFEIYDEHFVVLLGKKYGFSKMKKRDPIPQNAFRILLYYFGRDVKNNLYGRIKPNGILAAGNLLADNWETQNAVYPETFEILVCI